MTKSHCQVKQLNPELAAFHMDGAYAQVLKDTALKTFHHREVVWQYPEG